MPTSELEAKVELKGGFSGETMDDEDNDSSKKKDLLKRIDILEEQIKQFNKKIKIDDIIRLSENVDVLIEKVDNIENVLMKIPFQDVYQKTNLHHNHHQHQRFLHQSSIKNAFTNVQQLTGHAIPVRPTRPVRVVTMSDIDSK